MMSDNLRSKRYGKRWLILLGILLIILGVSGCGTLQTLVDKEAKTTPLTDWIGTASEGKSVPATSQIGDGKNVSLYFPDASGKALVKEERILTKTMGLARETVTQWLKGPSGKNNIQAAVDPATTLIDIGIKDGVATVDLSREFTQAYGKVSQEVTVYGLVNTLTQFPSVHDVKIRINGKPLNKLGNLDLNNLTYREGLVKGLTGGKSSVSGQSQNNSGSAATDSGAGLAPKTGKTAPLPKDSPSAINLF